MRTTLNVTNMLWNWHTALAVICLSCGFNICCVTVQLFTLLLISFFDTLVPFGGQSSCCAPRRKHRNWTKTTLVRSAGKINSLLTVNGRRPNVLESGGTLHFLSFCPSRPLARMLSSTIQSNPSLPFPNSLQACLPSRSWRSYFCESLRSDLGGEEV